MVRVAVIENESTSWSWTIHVHSQYLTTVTCDQLEKSILDIISGQSWANSTIFENELWLSVSGSHENLLLPLTGGRLVHAWCKLMITTYMVVFLFYFFFLIVICPSRRLKAQKSRGNVASQTPCLRPAHGPTRRYRAVRIDFWNWIDSFSAIVAFLILTQTCCFESANKNCFNWISYRSSVICFRQDYIMARWCRSKKTYCLFCNVDRIMTLKKLSNVEW